MSTTAEATHRRNGWSFVGAAIALVSLVWIVQRLDLTELQAAAAGADLRFVALVPLAILAEQLVRAWKWRLLLYELHRIQTLRRFGAIMAGFLASILIPLGVSPLVRSWLVAQLEAMPLSTVLASVAIDRLVDGVVFSAIVFFVLVFIAFPDPDGSIRVGLVASAIASAVLVVGTLLLLWRHKRTSAQGAGWALRVAGWLPERFVERARTQMYSFAEGIVWPRQVHRAATILAASVGMKLLAASHLLWAGLAFGIVLSPVSYLVLLTILGFLAVVTHTARIPGGFIVGAVFALELFGVDKEPAFAMAVVVFGSSLLTVGAVGGFVLWRHCSIVGDLKAQRQHADGAT